MTETVSNEQLLTDISNTEKECNAYQNIVSGFTALSELPETKNPYMFQVTARAYGGLLIGCTELLEKLRKIRRERGL